MKWHCMEMSFGLTLGSPLPEKVMLKRRENFQGMETEVPRDGEELV